MNMSVILLTNVQDKLTWTDTVFWLFLSLPYIQPIMDRMTRQYIKLKKKHMKTYFSIKNTKKVKWRREIKVEPLSINELAHFMFLVFCILSCFHRQQSRFREHCKSHPRRRHIQFTIV